MKISTSKANLIEKKPPAWATQTYLQARQEYNERYGEFVENAKRWRLAALGALGISIILAIGLIAVATQQKIVPYVVAVDDLGSAVAVSRAESAQRPDERVMKATLAEWVSNVRSVYVDKGAQVRIAKKAYAVMSGPASAKLTDYMKANHPYERAKTQTVTIKVQSVLPLSEETWRVEWLEEERNREGLLQQAIPMQATITTMISPPTDEATILKNPMGIYIRSFNWAERV